MERLYETILYDNDERKNSPNYHRQTKNDNDLAKLIMILPCLLPEQLQKSHDNHYISTFFTNTGKIKVGIFSLKMFVNQFCDGHLDKYNIEIYIHNIKDSLCDYDIIIFDYNPTVVNSLIEEKFSLFLLFPDKYMINWYSHQLYKYRNFNSRKKKKEVLDNFIKIITKLNKKQEDCIIIHLDSEINETLLETIYFDFSKYTFN